MRGDIRRAPKFGVADATSTTEVASCSPNSTPFSPQFMWWWTISCLRAAARGAARRSPTPSSLRSRSRRSPWTPVGAALLALRAFAPRTPVCVHPQAARLQQAPARARAGGLPAHRPLGAQLAVVLRSAAAHRLHPGAVRSLTRDGESAPRAGRTRRLRASPPATRATSGDCGCTSSARPTGCRSRSVWRPLTSPSARSPRRCSNTPPTAICCRPARCSSPTKASPAPSSSSSSLTRSAPNSVRPDRKDEPPRFGALGGIRQIDRVGQRRPQGPVLRSSTPRRPHP